MVHKYKNGKWCHLIRQDVPNYASKSRLIEMYFCVSFHFIDFIDFNYGNLILGKRLKLQNFKACYIKRSSIQIKKKTTIKFLQLFTKLLDKKILYITFYFFVIFITNAFYKFVLHEMFCQSSHYISYINRRHI